VICFPIQLDGKTEGVLYPDNRMQRGAFRDDDLELVELLAGQAAIAIENARLVSELRERNQRLLQSSEQIQSLNEQLGRKVRDRDSELAVVRAELARERGRYDYASIVGASDEMKRVFSELDRIITTELPVLIEASRRYGIAERKFFEILEEKHHHWWVSWLESLGVYRDVLQAAICEFAQEGNLVYHGRAGQEFFPGIRHVLNVFVDTPTESRIQQVKARKGLTEEAARHYLEELDRIRARRLRELFDSDWRDPARYDFVINTYYTNEARLSWVSAAIALDTNLVANTSKVGSENSGVPRKATFNFFMKGALDF
jgi:hypothetical protein